MKTQITLCILCLASLGFAQTKLRLNTPEELCSAYIKFINDGAKFEDYKLLTQTPDEVYFAELSWGSDQKKAQKHQNDQVELHKFWQAHWKEVDSKNVLGKRPYKFLSMKTKKKKSDAFFKEITILASDNTGKIHSFHLNYIGAVKSPWKIYDLNHQPPIDEQP